METPDNFVLRSCASWFFHIFVGSSTVDLLIYQTLCYTHDELRDVDVDDFVLKLCGLEEFLQK